MTSTPSKGLAQSLPVPPTTGSGNTRAGTPDTPLRYLQRGRASAANDAPRTPSPSRRDRHRRRSTRSTNHKTYNGWRGCVAFAVVHEGRQLLVETWLDSRQFARE